MKIRTPKVGEVWITDSGGVIYKVLEIVNTHRVRCMIVKSYIKPLPNIVQEYSINDFMSVLLPPEEREVPEILYNKG